MATIQDSSSARAVEQKEHPLISRGLAIGNIGGLFCIGALLITAKNVGLFTTPEAFAIGKTIVVGAAKLSATFFALPAWPLVAIAAVLVIGGTVISRKGEAAQRAERMPQATSSLSAALK